MVAMQQDDRAQARGMEIERLDRRVAELVMLALDAERELAEARAEAQDLRSQLREVEERLTLTERELELAHDEIDNLGPVLDGAVADVVATRAELRMVTAELAQADQLDERLVEAWDSLGSEGDDPFAEVRAAMRTVRVRVVSGRRGGEL